MVKRVCLGVWLLVALVGAGGMVAFATGEWVTYRQGSTVGVEYVVPVPAADHMHLVGTAAGNANGMEVLLNGVSVQNGYSVDYSYTAPRNRADVITFRYPFGPGGTFSVQGYNLSIPGEPWSNHWASQVPVLPASLTWDLIWTGINQWMFTGLMRDWLVMSLGLWMALLFVRMIAKMVRGDNNVSVDEQISPIGAPNAGRYMDTGFSGGNRKRYED
jgi:hypothetical protein